MPCDCGTHMLEQHGRGACTETLSNCTWTAPAYLSNCNIGVENSEEFLSTLVIRCEQTIVFNL